MKHPIFWERNPALLYGISILIGTSSYLFWPAPWNWVWPISWGVYLTILRRWQPLILLFGGILYALFLCADISRAEIGYFSPSSLSPHQSPFARGLIYRGMFTANGQKVPCSIHHPFSKGRPQADSDYVVQGELKKRGIYNYVFRAKQWKKVENTFSLAEFRFQTKELLRKYLDRKLQNPGVALFLGSLLSGDVEDRSLRYQFGKLGLQHILAISGFHFAILIAFCSSFLALFLPYHWKIIALLCAINIYFLFVGALPAVQRSYLTALLFLAGKLMNRHSSALNLLGASLLVEVLFDPYVSGGLGFQLSFLSCIGILLFRPLFLPFALWLFPKRSPLTLTRFAQHGYLISSFLREGIAITLAVNAAILPLILTYFHTFPLLSLIYNLFFPLLVSLALFLLLLSLLADLLFPPFSIPLFSLTNFFSTQLLELVAYPPLFLDYSLKSSHFPAWIIPIYLFSLFWISLLTNSCEIGYDPNRLSYHGDRSSVG